MVFHFLYGSKMFNIPLFFRKVRYSLPIAISILSSVSSCRKLHQPVEIDSSVRQLQLFGTVVYLECEIV
jgi:hypothetical protein